MERRRQPRVRTEGEIRVRILAGGKLVDGELVDLNNAGAFVATDLVLEKGEKIQLELDIPGESTQQPLQAVVARCSAEIKGHHKVIPAGLGLVFVGQDQAEKELIQKVVMMTLTVDLLGYGARKNPLPGSDDTGADDEPAYSSEPHQTASS
jgi:Tfp pilus assembly protein PilZ